MRLGPLCALSVGDLWAVGCKVKDLGAQGLRGVEFGTLQPLRFWGLGAFKVQELRVQDFGVFRSRFK